MERNTFFKKAFIVSESEAIRLTPARYSTGTGDPMRNQRAITTNGVLQALGAGGQIQYRPISDGRKRTWELWARRPDEQFQHVISAKTGGLRIFKSADALFAFHLRVFPNATGVFIPVEGNETHEFPSERRAETRETDRDFEDSDD